MPVTSPRTVFVRGEWIGHLSEYLPCWNCDSSHLGTYRFPARPADGVRVQWRSRPVTSASSQYVLPGVFRRPAGLAEMKASGKWPRNQRCTRPLGPDDRRSRSGSSLSDAGRSIGQARDCEGWMPSRRWWYLRSRKVVCAQAGQGRDPAL